MENLINNILDWLREYPIIYTNLKFIGVLFLAYVSFLIVKFIAFRIISRIVNRTKNIYDDILLNKKILRRVAYIGPVVVFHEFAYLIPDLNRFFQTTVSNSDCSNHYVYCRWVGCCNK